jgi:hypothetical protein
LLIVFDDLSPQIRVVAGNPLFVSLIFNRRHLIIDGTISLIFVSQKYTQLPPLIR